MAQNGRSISNNIPNQPRRLGLMNLRGTPALLAVIVVMGLVGWLYLSQASEVTETTRRIRELRQQKEELQRRNDQLAYDVARLASVDRLEERARELGYVAVWEARFLAVNDYPVQGEDTTVEAMASARDGSAERTTSSAVVNWWETIAGQFEVWVSADQP